MTIMSTSRSERLTIFGSVRTVMSDPITGDPDGEEVGHSPTGTEQNA